MMCSVICFSCDTIEKLKKRCEALEKDIRDPWKFKDFYQFTFNFAKNPGQKGLGKCVCTACSQFTKHRGKIVYYMQVRGLHGMG